VVKAFRVPGRMWSTDNTWILRFATNALVKVTQKKRRTNWSLVLSENEINLFAS
jgi:hypothetical protein